jgi:hypothetical protein
MWAVKARRIQPGSAISRLPDLVLGTAVVTLGWMTPSEKLAETLQ